MLSLLTKIEQIKKVGPVYLKKLHKLGIKTIKDLFFHFPHRYEDFSQILPISQLKKGQPATIQGKIAEIENARIFRKRMVLTEALIKDDSGVIKAVWFNQPYLTETLKKNRLINFSGKLSSARGTLVLSNPAYEIVGTVTKNVDSSQFTHTGRLTPVYPETTGLSSRYLRYLIKPLLPLSSQFVDFLPEQIKKNFSLMNLGQAIKQIHFPDNLLLARKARQRLSFDELFLMQLMFLQQKQKLSQEKAQPIPFNQKLIKSFVKNLPFKLTNSQKLAAWEIFQDLAQDKPMNRLLNGDVGSGKTVVAVMVALETAKAGHQTALMAPTEILAKQHFQTFKNLLKKSGVKIALLTRTESTLSDYSSKRRTIPKIQLKKQISQGKIDIAIGTHALLQEDLNFKNLCLTIIDEQHRFGVLQRAALQKNIHQPHFLSMTATPIPRTLALTVYGDLDISLIKELPKGRQKIITQIVAPDDRQKAYNFIKKQIQQKKQAFVICPRIETQKPKAKSQNYNSKLKTKKDEWTDVRAVTEEYEKLSKKIFPKFKIAMLHGKLKPKEKEEIMKKFKDGKIDVLVSTSVVEVGVDIPNATIMLIEGADRFGLAQLHQFRGRIGRGKDQSHCFLFTDSSAKKTHQRLKAILKAKDGFELAEKDLKIRGPGNFIGAQQWGLPDLIMASLDDLELIQKSRQAAKKVLGENLSNPLLKNKLDNFQKTIHLE
jgi:ATP-dependent DNA helicase RecG